MSTNQIFCSPESISLHRHSCFKGMSTKVVSLLLALLMAFSLASVAYAADKSPNISEEGYETVLSPDEDGEIIPNEEAELEFTEDISEDCKSILSQGEDDETIPSGEIELGQDLDVDLTEIIGDADLDGKVTVKDATKIQKHIAKILVLEEKAQKLADFLSKPGINIKCATYIQKYVAKFNLNGTEGEKIGQIYDDESKNPAQKKTESEIKLSVNNNEFLVSDKTENIYFYAEVDKNVNRIILIDDNNNQLAEMRDDGNYDVSGDNIVDDGIFTCILNIDLSIGNTLTYFAVTEINGKKAVSNDVEIYIVAPFTDQELNDMETVDNTLAKLRESNDYLNMSVEQRAETVSNALIELAKRGLIKEESIVFDESANMITYRYTSGVLGGELLVEFDQDYNGNTPANSDDMNSGLSERDIVNIGIVDEALAYLRESDEYTIMSIEQKKKAVLDVLGKFAIEELIIEESVAYNEATQSITFRYSSGILGGEFLSEFASDKNSLETIDKDENIKKDATILKKSILGNTSNTIDYMVNNNVSSGSNTDIVASGAVSKALILWSFNLSGDDPSKRVPFYEETAKEWDRKGLKTTRIMGTTVPDFKKMAGYNVVMVSGHGTHYKDTPVFCISEKSSTANMQTYAIDLKQERIASVGFVGDGNATRYVIFPKLITECYNNNDLSGSFIFSEACTFMGSYNPYDQSKGIVNEIFPNAFINKGAKSTVGFYNSVLAVYSRDFIKTCIDRLIVGDTIQNAYNKAINTHGANDGQKSPYTAVPHLRKSASTLTINYQANGGTIPANHGSFKLSGDFVYNKSNNTKYGQVWTYNVAKPDGLVNASTFGLQRAGYTFIGWGKTQNTSPVVDGKNVFDQNDTALKPATIYPDLANKSATITLYAIWARTLTVNYHANGGTIPTTQDTFKLSDGFVYRKSNNTKYVQTWVYNIPQKDGLLNASTFGLQKSGYTFIGWGKTASVLPQIDGKNVFDQDDVNLKPAAIYPELEKQSGTITLYAIWKANNLYD